MRPPALHRGDLVRIVAPSGRVNPTDVNRAITIFRKWGLRTLTGDHVFKDNHQFAAKDQDRLLDLQIAFDDPGCKAVICARGGYGCTRIVDFLDLSGFKEHPKWVVGYSDITALHCLLHREKFESIHAMMPSQLGKKGSEVAVQSLKDQLFTKGFKMNAGGNVLNRSGSATGPLVGGNLSLLENMLSTPTDLDTKGKILFLEDVGEYLYRLDRMIVHLKRAGKLEALAGLVIGQFTDMKDGDVPFGMNGSEMIAHHTREYNYPVGFGFPIGHSLDNYALPVGRQVKLEVSGQGSILE